MEDFNFQKIESMKGRSGQGLRPDAVRVNKNVISIPMEIGQHFNETRYVLEKTGTERVLVAIAFDPARKALKIWEDRTGFATYRRTSDFGINMGLTMSIPANLRRLGIERGDYVKVDGLPNVYRLAV